LSLLTLPGFWAIAGKITRDAREQLRSVRSHQQNLRKLVT
jgi:hypothetical protein